MSRLLKEFSNTSIQWLIANSETLKLRSRELPVLLVIGYPGCPQTQALAQILEQDPALCHLVKNRFSSYLVDKFTAPHIDEYCQDFHLKFTQSPGAWPLIVLLEPEQLLPFYSTVAFNQSLDLNLMEQLDSISQIVEQDSRMSRQTALVLQEKFAKDYTLPPRNETASQPLPTSNLVDDFVQLTLEQADLQWGGLMVVPKFPHTTIHQALLNILVLERPNNAQDIYNHLIRTLQSFIRTGIYDHLDGGFFRFCHDQHWQHPHFEKSVLDNAQLAIFLSEVAHFNKDASFALAASETVDWIMRYTQVEGTGFYAAAVNEKLPNDYDRKNDTDYKNDSASNYLINKDDVKALLDDEEWAIAKIMFGFDKSPMLPGKWHVQCWFNPEVVAEKLTLPPKKVQYLFDPIKQKIKALRASNLNLQMTETMSISTNSKLLIALLSVGKLKNNEQMIESALQLDSKLEKRIISLIFNSDKGNWCFEDVAFYIESQIVLLQHTWSESKFVQLIKLTDMVISDLWQDGVGFRNDNHGFPWSDRQIEYDQNNEHPLALFYTQLQIINSLQNSNNEYEYCINQTSNTLIDFFQVQKLKASSAFKALLAAKKQVIILFGSPIDTLDWLGEITDKSLKFSIFQIPLTSSIATAHKVNKTCALVLSVERKQLLESKKQLIELAQN